MNWYPTKKIWIALTMLLIGPLYLTAATESAIDSTKMDTTWRPLKKTTFLIIPSNLQLQFAGGIGLVSAGMGWDYGKKKQWSTDLLAGYVPKYDTDRAKITLTARQTYTPWSITLHDRVRYQPLRTGMYLNTTAGRQFWLRNPEKYPTNYYFFSTRLRINAFLGQEITYNFDKTHSYLEGMKFYVDFHTNELYLITAVQNSSLRPWNYIGLALGFKFQIRRL